MEADPRAVAPLPFIGKRGLYEAEPLRRRKSRRRFVVAKRQDHVDALCQH